MNCYNMTTRWEFGHEVKIQISGQIYEWVTKHNANANDNIYAFVAPHDAYTCNHIHWASCRVCHLHAHMHLGSRLSLSCHLHGYPRACGLFTLILLFLLLALLSVPFPLPQLPEVCGKPAHSAKREYGLHRRVLPLQRLWPQGLRL